MYKFLLIIFNKMYCKYLLRNLVQNSGFTKLYMFGLNPVFLIYLKKLLIKKFKKKQKK